MSKIDLIIDALSISQNSIWSKLNEQALAAARELQAEKQEPIAWMVLTQNDKKLMLWGQEKPPIFDSPVKLIPLYTAPPKREWVGLTDEECRRFNNRLSGSGVAEEIETKLKEKNGG